MIIFVAFVLSFSYFFSKIDTYWYLRTGAIFWLSMLVYLLPSYYSSRYGVDTSELLFSIYFQFYSFFIASYVCIFILLLKYYKFDRAINYKRDVYNSDWGFFNIPAIIVIMFVIYLMYIVKGDVLIFLSLSHHEQVALFESGNRSTIDLFLFSIILLFFQQKKNNFGKLDFLVSVLYSLLLLISFGRNPMMYYVFGLFSMYCIKNKKSISFINLFGIIFIACVFMGFINARRAVGFDLELMLHHVLDRGFLFYVFGTEFNVPARILYFIEKANGAEDIFKFPGYSLIVVTINSVIPSFIWERLPTASMELSRSYGTTGGLPLVIEVYSNFGMKLLWLFGILFAIFFAVLDMLLSRLLNTGTKVGVLLLAGGLFVALNSQRIDFAISFKMFIVITIISCLINELFRRKVVFKGAM
ncbi:O-antigen polymerase [Vibrio chagasii]|uniref:O-antigen polymerase n=1 Tax=Vibrio chagasii TaxID=170679 RepID=UPI003DA9D5BD